jgi:hypothetical protein
MMLTNRLLKTDLIVWRDARWIQTALKDLTTAAFTKLKSSLLTNGFAMPFTVWEDEEGILWILDGHHRQKVMMALEVEGHTIPDHLPANFIACRDKQEAAKLVLIYSSVYATVTNEGLYEFLHEHNLDVDQLLKEAALPDLDLDVFAAGWMRDDAPPGEDPGPELVDRAEELQATWQVRQGDLFGLGSYTICPKCGKEHRLPEGIGHDL